ncbi:ATP-binding protein [Dysgonomonas sp. ZJ279]|uniref:ATP-binding protein n=1 Tax=Dysgonomonas sp. ZJ279 TaxID=2709796 RepID=UPI0013E9B562|nr:hypothetical protein [Dysgonomonas sp. ZJ279]
MSVLLILASFSLLIAFGYYQRSKRAKNKVISIIADNCVKCQLCVKRCRSKALGVEDSDNGKCIVLKYSEKCTACRDCIAICKFNALELVSRKQTEYQKSL